MSKLVLSYPSFTFLETFFARAWLDITDGEEGGLSEDRYNWWLILINQITKRVQTSLSYGTLNVSVHSSLCGIRMRVTGVRAFERSEVKPVDCRVCIRLNCTPIRSDTSSKLPFIGQSESRMSQNGLDKRGKVFWRSEEFVCCPPNTGASCCRTSVSLGYLV